MLNQPTTDQGRRKIATVKRTRQLSHSMLTADFYTTNDPAAVPRLTKNNLTVFFQPTSDKCTIAVSNSNLESIKQLIPTNFKNAHEIKGAKKKFFLGHEGNDLRCFVLEGFNSNSFFSNP